MQLSKAVFRLFRYLWMMKWGTLGKPFQQMTVDSNWIPNTIRKIQDNTNALRNAPKYSAMAKILCQKSITLSFIHYLNYGAGTWRGKQELGLVEAGKV